MTQPMKVGDMELESLQAYATNNNEYPEYHQKEGNDMDLEQIVIELEDRLKVCEECVNDQDQIIRDLKLLTAEQGEQINQLITNLDKIVTELGKELGV